MEKNWRIYVLVISIFLFGGGVITRLFSLQIIQYNYYSAWAKDQHQIYQELLAQRGEIFTRDLSPLAINKEFYQVYIIPKEIIDNQKEDLSERLSFLLDLNKEMVLHRMSKIDDPYEPLKHKVSESVARQIEELDAPGVKTAPEVWRYYPYESLASHLLGFVGMNEKGKIGQYGLEGYYEKELKGKDGFVAGEKDTTGYWIPSLSQELKPAQDGADLVLTIDQNIQFQAEKELEELIKKWQAEAGTIIILEPKTGAVRAMASQPNFNPNQYREIEDINIFLNPSVQKVYEPGSVFKPITMAIGLESDKIEPTTIYHDEGRVQIKGSFISNVDDIIYGDQTMTQVLEKSINTGAVFVQQKVGESIFRDYLQRFGLSEPTGIDLIGEVGGDISNLFTGREINLATISFGQGITMTPLGLAAALSAIANEGKVMRPYLVEKIIWPDKEEEIIEPEVIREVISPETAKELTKMLVSVVENGFGRPARISGYNIAGKTGTAQIPDWEKGGYSDETIHSFVGFAPAFDPKFIILIKIDKPKGIRFASDSVSPSFRKLTKYLFNYLEIPPQ